MKIPDLRFLEVQEEAEEEEEVFIDSDLTGCDVPPELRPAAGGHGRVHPAAPVSDPLAGLLQSGLPLRPAPQPLLQLLHLSSAVKVKKKHHSERPRVTTGFN